MRAPRLLQHFDRICEAPDAVPRLRRFILDLAVRGKLVEQDADDEPAGELLKRVLESGSTSPVQAAPRSDEAPFLVPASWSWIRVGHAASVEMGQSPSSDHYNQSRDGMPFYQGKTDFGSRHPTPRYWCSQPTKIARAGDILISVRAPVGPTNVANEDCCIGRGLAALRPHSVVDPEFFLRCLEAFEPALAALGFGTTFVAINKKHLVSFPIPLPPPAEQRRIVARIDDLMALCDRLEVAHSECECQRDRLVAASLGRLDRSEKDEAFHVDARFHLANLTRLTARPEQVKALREAILNLGIRGHLVAQSPGDEPASALLQRIEAEKKQLTAAGQVRRQERVPDLDESERPFPLPDGWQWARLGHLVEDADSGWSPKSEGFPRTGENWGVLKVSAVSWDKFLPEENKQLLPGVIPRPAAHVLSSDFLISRANTSELVAKCVIVDEQPKNLILSDKIVRLRISKQCDQQFLRIVNNHAHYARAHYAREASGTSLSMKNVSRAVIYALPIPVPPMAEQRRIVARLSELMALCSRLESELTTAETEGRGLLSAVLREALAVGA